MSILAFCDLSCGVLTMMRNQVMVARHADLAVGTPAQLARHDQREHARDVAAEGQQLQVEHELRVLLEAGGNANRTVGQLDRFLEAGLRVLNALLHFAHRIQVLAHLRRVGAAERRRERTGFLEHRVEQAALLLDAGAPLLGAAAVAEEALEDDARVELGHVGRRLAAPRDGVDVEAVAGIARPLRRRVERHLDRGDPAVLAQMPGGNLIGRSGEADLGARPRAVVGMHAGEPRPGGAVVIATAVALAVGFEMRQVREDVEVIAHTFKRLQVGRQLVLAARLTRLPLRMDDAVRRVDKPKPHGRLLRPVAWAESAGIMESSSGSATLAPIPFSIVRRVSAFLVRNVMRSPLRLLGAQACAIRLWNGTLFTTPSTSEAKV